MKKVLSILLAMVLVLTVMCSFSFAAEATSEETNSANSTRALIIACPYCESYNATGVTVRSYAYTYHTSCSHYTYGTDTYIRYEYVTNCTCNDCGKTFTVHFYPQQYEDVFTSCEGWD